MSMEDTADSVTPDNSDKISLRNRAVWLAACILLVGGILWSCPLGPVYKPSTACTLSPITIGGYEVGVWTDYGNNRLYSVKIGALPEIYIGNSLPSAIAGAEKIRRGII